MRIALDGLPLCEAPTGVGHYTFELARALAHSYPTSQFELIAPFPFHPDVLKQHEQEKLSNLRFINPDASRMHGRWWSFDLPRYLRRASIDLFHGTNYELPLWGRRRGIVTVHDLSSLMYPELHQKKLVRRMRLRLPLAVKSAKAIVTPTETVKAELCARLKVKAEKVTNIPEAPREYFHPMRNDESSEIRSRLGIEDKFVLFVGTLEPRKNLVTLLKAFSLILRETRWRPQLVVAGGEGWLMEETFSLMNSAEIKERLCLTGYVRDEELRALYSSCRVFVYPSLYEGFGLPPLEAMACGAPVIASSAAALQETIGDAAVLVDPLDAEKLFRQIVSLLDDDKRRDELVEAGLRHAARFSWEKAAHSTYELYRQVLG